MKRRTPSRSHRYRKSASKEISSKPTRRCRLPRTIRESEERTREPSALSKPNESPRSPAGNLKRVRNDLDKEDDSKSTGKNPKVSAIHSVQIETGPLDVHSSDEVDTRASKRQRQEASPVAADHNGALVAPPAIADEHREESKRDGDEEATPNPPASGSSSESKGKENAHQTNLIDDSDSDSDSDSYDEHESPSHVLNYTIRRPLETPIKLKRVPLYW